MKPQDILIALKIQSLCDEAGGASAPWPQRRLASETGVSLSEVSAACRRLAQAGLLDAAGRRIVRPALREFLVHALKYVFPAAPGEMSRGLPTGYAAPPLRDEFLASSDDPPPVWPDARGPVRGAALQPLYKSVPKAARRDPRLYEYLALADAVRAGRARERAMAVQILSKRLG